jgi:hypothetical protein
MTGHAPTALRQPFPLRSATSPAAHRGGYRRCGGTPISVRSELAAEDGNEGSIWLIAQGKHK